MGLALRRVAAIVAAKGGTVAEITVGDCLELLRITEDVQLGADATSPYFYQLLRSAGMLAGGPPAGRALRTQGQLGCAALIDRYGIECLPVRDLLVDYLAERRPALDYASLHKLSYTLGRLFWRDLELHHPGIGSLRLAADVATGWKQRIATKTTRSVDNNGAITRVLRGPGSTRPTISWWCGPSTSTSSNGRSTTRPDGARGHTPARCAPKR